MTKKIYVTSAQRAAAQYIVERDTARGRGTRAAIKKIAEAIPAASSTSATSPTTTAVHAR